MSRIAAHRGAFECGWDLTMGALEFSAGHILAPAGCNKVTSTQMSTQNSDLLDRDFEFRSTQMSPHNGS